MGRVSLFIAVAALTAAVTAAILIALDGRSGPAIVIEDPLVDQTIVVAVDGAVATPGLYTLPAGARLADALAAAGGADPAADLEELNPARRLADEERLVVPGRAAEPPPAASAPITPAPPPTGRQPLAQPTTLARLDLNRASAAELDALPGIGPALAARIVAHREEYGQFRTIEELARVSGISSRMVEELRPLVVVGG